MFASVLNSWTPQAIVEAIKQLGVTVCVLVGAMVIVYKFVESWGKRGKKE